MGHFVGNFVVLNIRTFALCFYFRALFWTDWDGHNPRIEGCSMSGEGRSIIHKISPAEGGGWPNGLTIDYDFKRLYWIDAR